MHSNDRSTTTAIPMLKTNDKCQLFLQSNYNQSNLNLVKRIEWLGHCYKIRHISYSTDSYVARLPFIAK